MTSHIMSLKQVLIWTMFSGCVIHILCILLICNKNNANLNRQDKDKLKQHIVYSRVFTGNHQWCRYLKGKVNTFLYGIT